MTDLRAATAAAMADFAAGPEGRLLARFRFGREFPGFDGHFPSRPLLPGVCGLECMRAMLEAWAGQPVAITDIISARFLLPVGPDEELLASADATETGGGRLSINGSLHSEGEVAARIKLCAIRQCQAGAT